MSLLEYPRGGVVAPSVTSWNRTIWKETTLKKEADDLDAAEREEEAQRAPMSPAEQQQIRDQWMPKLTPRRRFRHRKGAIVADGPAPLVGAFRAQVTAVPNTGFLPKPNYYVPGVQRGLGPLPKPLRRHVVDEDEKHGPKAVRAAALAAHYARASSSTAPAKVEAAALLTSTSSPGLSSHSPRRTAPAALSAIGGRPPSGPKRQIAEARMESHQQLLTPGASFGASSRFLAAKEHNAQGWSKDGRALTRADSGPSFYWGC